MQPEIKKIKYPRLLIDLKKIADNTTAVLRLCRQHGVELTAVTKAVLSDPKITRAIFDAGCSSLADSHLQNLVRLRAEYGKKAALLMLRQPMEHETIEAADTSDRILVSVPEAADRLDRLVPAGKRPGIVLMVELGEGREGIRPERVIDAVKRINNLKKIDLDGIGTNLFCQIKTHDQLKCLKELAFLAAKAETVLGHPLKTVSGGSSSVLPLLGKKSFPSAVNELRIGEAILLGKETISNRPFGSLSTDAFVLEAEVLEADKKSYNLKESKQSVLAVGKHELGQGKLYFLEPGIRFLRSSSDHTVAGTGGKTIGTGCVLKAVPDYYALLGLMTSPFVYREYI